MKRTLNILAGISTASLLIPLTVKLVQGKTGEAMIIASIQVFSLALLITTNHKK